MLNCLKHICFDKDGTITDVHVYWSDIINKRAYRLLDYYGLDSVHLKTLAYAMGIDLGKKRIIPQGPVGYKPRNFVIDAAHRVLRTIGVDAKAEEINEIFMSVDREMQEKNNYHIKLLESVYEAFQTSKDLGLKISIYTSDRTKNALYIMEKLKLDGYIDTIVGGDEIEKPKPDAEGFKKACERVGVPVARSIYVGDTLDDMVMADSCGSLGGVGVATGLCSREQLLGQARFVFDNLKDLSRYLEKSKMFDG